MQETGAQASGAGLHATLGGQDHDDAQQARMHQEAQQIAYLNTLRLEDIEDEMIRHSIATLLHAQSTSTQEKFDTVQRLVLRSRINSMMNKIAALNDAEKQQLSAHSVKTLQQVSGQAQEMTAQDMTRAHDALHVMQEALERIGQAQIAQGMLGKRAYDTRMDARAYRACAANMARQVQTLRDARLNKTRERLGIA